MAEGGQVLLEGMFRDLFRCTADCVPRVLDMAFGRDTIGALSLTATCGYFFNSSSFFSRAFSMLLQE
mgnify:CR=1 FL=1